MTLLTGASTTDGLLHTTGDLRAPAARVTYLRQDAGCHLGVFASSASRQEAVAPFVYGGGCGGSFSQLMALLL